MRILLCNIAWMKYYKGVTDQDIPVNGGSYITEHKAGGEVHNFYPIDADDGCHYCYGYVETKFNRKPDKLFDEKQHNELRIENIEGCAGMVDDSSVEDVLVIFCAKPDRGHEKTDSHIVGWYQHATVYRKHQAVKLQYEDGEVFTKWYNILGKKENVVLLPRSVRFKKTDWWAPRTKENRFGFGQANIWYPANNETDASKKYISRVVKLIEEYCGENWIDWYE
ncbi:hypothetical protein [Clostridium sp. HBUAS56010]|uniref:hypothetical protein n=1 Tax=Clostridium sp. HBUAS56010 TaxID=2571127 RepID=UPI001177B7C3|nr:hypothetical protein [Clostridium sp. HBUAS56010]